MLTEPFKENDKRISTNRPTPHEILHCFLLRKEFQETANQQAEHLPTNDARKSKENISRNKTEFFWPEEKRKNSGSLRRAQKTIQTIRAAVHDVHTLLRDRTRSAYSEL